MSQKIIPYLWFDHQAEEAALFYTSVFKDSSIGQITHYGEGTPGVPGQVMTVNFNLRGQEFVALNGGPEFSFTPAISFLHTCESQAEVDELWEKLTTGGKEGQCGWLIDPFGISWQIVPTALGSLIAGPDPEGAKRAVAAMLQMKKLDLDQLQQAYDGN